MSAPEVFTRAMMIVGAASFATKPIPMIEPDLSDMIRVCNGGGIVYIPRPDWIPVLPERDRKPDKDEAAGCAHAQCPRSRLAREQDSGGE